MPQAYIKAMNLFVDFNLLVSVIIMNHTLCVSVLKTIESVIQHKLIKLFGLILMQLHSCYTYFTLQTLTVRIEMSVLRNLMVISTLNLEVKKAAIIYLCIKQLTVFIVLCFIWRFILVVRDVY